MTTFNLGKVDYDRSGRRNCLATIELTWDGSRCSVCASIWNPRTAIGKLVEWHTAHMGENNG